MHIQTFRFGQISIDGSTYEHDVVIEDGAIRKRRKKPSKKFKEVYGHTPLSVDGRERRLHDRTRRRRAGGSRFAPRLQ